jgi:hypothetical protein
MKVGEIMAGRPLKFQDAEELYNLGIEYIKKCIKDKEHLTFTGLCISLDTTRETLNDYESGKYDNDKNKFSDSVKRLKTYCENYAEKRLFENNPTGAIFALKNYGWKDKTESDVNVANKDNVPFKVADMSDTEIEEQIKKLAAEVK